MPRSTNISSAIFVAVAAFVLLSCETHSDEFEIAGSSDDIVVLADGATIAAPAGTRARALADWIGAGASGESFALGDALFEPGSALMTRSGLGDAAMLGTLLGSTQDKRIVIIGHGGGSGDPVADRLLAQERSEAIAAFLAERGIEPRRLEIRSDPDLGRPHPSQLTIAGRGEAPRDPLLTASR
ncbi:OmpA family protein [Novosphingobium sp. ST904]|uniref:OmpA family protein n=1 Tax=Novosphingobium sp. ST904 TaxID=1684385 RepID=UPI001042FCB0|nr:OmpA family protein [Novosphingobium sp. ST904]TCM32426.1 OmpA family protein [Novosphingobium sp. ST904]